MDENFSQTAAFIGVTLSKERFESIKAFSKSFIAGNEELLRGRAESGFIKDCHGDIHSEHISIGERIAIIDCIEFNERFRLTDVVADIAFLSMDLDFHNRADLAKKLDASYFDATSLASALAICRRSLGTHLIQRPVGGTNYAVAYGLAAGKRA